MRIFWHIDCLRWFETLLDIEKRKNSFPKNPSANKAALRWNSFGKHPDSKLNYQKLPALELHLSRTKQQIRLRKKIIFFWTWRLIIYYFFKNCQVNFENHLTNFSISAIVECKKIFKRKKHLEGKRKALLLKWKDLYVWYFGGNWWTRFRCPHDCCGRRLNRWFSRFAGQKNSSSKLK